MLIGLIILFSNARGDVGFVEGNFSYFGLLGVLILIAGFVLEFLQWFGPSKKRRGLISNYYNMVVPKFYEATARQRPAILEQQAKDLGYKVKLVELNGRDMKVAEGKGFLGLGKTIARWDPKKQEGNIPLEELNPERN